jgi:acetyltransferase-like isoleucine patch superfamily enzyme
MGVRRTIALVLYYGFAQFIPSWPGSVRRFGFASRRGLAGWLFAECGPDLNLHARVSFGNGRQIHAANNVGIGQGTVFNGRGDVFLGPHLTMGPRCTFITGDHEVRSRRPLREQHPFQKPIRVGEDVYLGAHVIVLPGTTLGDGVVVGAGSVVSRDVEAYQIVAGNPIRVIGQRE